MTKTRRLAFRTSLVLALAGHAAACTSGPHECTPGSVGCACRADSPCDEGAVCNDSTRVCEGTHAVALPAIDAEARSCELLVEDDGAQVIRAVFASSVRGTSLRQAPKTAVTFYAFGDAPIARDSVRIELAGRGGMRIARARCFDRTGRPLIGGGIAVRG